MNIDDSRLIVRFQRLITEMLVEKRLGQRRPGLTDDLYQTWRDGGRRGLREAPEYRDVLLTVPQPERHLGRYHDAVWSLDANRTWRTSRVRARANSCPYRRRQEAR